MQQVVQLHKEYDKLQSKYGDPTLFSIYGAGCIDNPNVMFIFMNPTGRNISSIPSWKGLRAPWIGTKQVWDIFENLGLLKSEIYLKIKSIKPEEWDSDFANEVKYFGRKAYLAQSPQLYKQMAMASGFEKVFEVGPVFRANPSFTSRHDTEFTMYDVELSYVESIEELLQEEEKMIARMFKEISEKYLSEIKNQYQQDLVTPVSPFPRLSFFEAKEILKSRGIEGEKKDDLSPEDEREIGKYIKEKYEHDFVFIYDYPTSSRAFYSMRYENRSEYTKSFDLLYKGLEITSGAIREYRSEVLKSKIIEKGFNPDDFSSYLAFFEYGCPPHGGFALGPTRILMQMLGVENVREVTYIYRGVKRLNP